ncbi:MAG: SipW-dependent-type signal peptide-containing protein [Clostridium sp.]|jgi:predicted ribosomally synthesized peptide with SipW-like signal peptide|nr:SipW-dependent-type signal peptide-containing protein [Clostridium sp.]
MEDRKQKFKAFAMKYRVWLILAMALLVGLIVGVAWALLNDNDDASNVFTVGNVDVSLHEPKWENKPVTYPGRVIDKDPYLTNEGESDAYVFLEVRIPHATVKTIGSNGLDVPAADVELFSLVAPNVIADKDHPEDGGDWYLVKKTVATIDGQKYTSYLYGYKEITHSNDDTTRLFEQVKCAQVVEGEIPMGTIIKMPLIAYAVQVDNVSQTISFFEQLEAAYALFSGV